MGQEKKCVRSGSVTSLQIFFELSNQGALDGEFGMYGREVCAETLKERDNFEDLVVDGKIIINWILNK